MVRIAAVDADSLGAALGLARGDELRAVNGRVVEDFLDWEFLSAEDEFTVDVRHVDGREQQLFVTRRDGEAMGLELEPPTVRRCANRCEFCFIEGLPKGLRKPLYIRDDDYRLSFAYGNFATLSNVKEKDVARIIEYRLSPLYVSVHATPWEQRKVILNNPRVPNIVEQLSRLAAGGIQFHCQMVIVPGLNDGEILDESFRDLWALGDAVISVAIVPVGLTQFSHLYTGKSMDRDVSRELLAHVDRWAARALSERGDRWVYGSDELYLLAEAPLPDAAHYGDFAQIENGVGAVTSLRSRVRDGVERLPRLDGRQIAVVTGVSMAPLMPPLLDQLEQATGARFELLPVDNSLFGPTTTTAGLLVSDDIRRALAGRTDFDLALIPAECINDQGLFLDDQPFIAVREEFPFPVYPSYDFIDVLEAEVAGTPRIRSAA
jgi:putative radical SAM enzyme (TIGR03279 family)